MTDADSRTADLLPDLRLESSGRNELFPPNGDPDGPVCQIDMVEQMVWRALLDGIPVPHAPGASPMVMQDPDGKYRLHALQLVQSPNGPEQAEYVSPALSEVRRRQFVLT